MAKKYSRTIEDLFTMFSDTLEPADVLTSKLMAQISSAITKERLSRQMSQEKFAEYIGVGQSLVSRWEHGNYNFSIRKLSEIAVKLNLDVDLTIEPHTKKGKNINVGNTTIGANTHLTGIGRSCMKMCIGNSQILATQKNKWRR